MVCKRSGALRGALRSSDPNPALSGGLTVQVRTCNPSVAPLETEKDTEGCPEPSWGQCLSSCWPSFLKPFFPPLFLSDPKTSPSQPDPSALSSPSICSHPTLPDQRYSACPDLEVTQEAKPLKRVPLAKDFPNVSRRYTGFWKRNLMCNQNSCAPAPVELEIMVGPRPGA